jgi:hypothetical protein
MVETSLGQKSLQPRHPNSQNCYEIKWFNYEVLVILVNTNIRKLEFFGIQGYE